MTDSAYLYTYFKSRGNWQDDQRVFFAVSRDGLHFREINGHKPLIESDLGTKGLRDPHIFRSRIDRRFCLLATDLDASSQKWKEFSVNGSRSILVARSDDLVHWEKELVPVCGDEIGCVWAPKVCFDEKEDRYIMYFSGSGTTEVSMRVFYTTTKDFKTFTKPEILIDKYPNTEKKHYPYGLIYRKPQKYITHIDSTTIEVDGEFYRFTKNEALKIIEEEHSSGILSDYEIVTDCVAGEMGVEGPGIYKLLDSDTYILMMDGYIRPNKGVGYFPLAATTEELKKGAFRRLRKDEYEFPERCKHGSVTTITEEEYRRLEAL